VQHGQAVPEVGPPPRRRFRLRDLTAEQPVGRLAALSALGLARGLLETTVVVLVVALAFAAAGSTPAGLPLLDGLPWSTGTLVVAIVVTTAAAGVVQWWSARLISRTSAQVVARNRRRLLRAYVGASWLAQSRERAGTLQELLTTSATAVGHAVVATAGAVVAASQLVVMAVAAVTISPLVGAGVGVLGVAVVLVAHPFRERTRVVAVDAAGASRDLAVVVAETTSLDRDLRTSGVEQAVLDRADELVARTARLFGRVRFEAQVVPAMTRDVTIVGVAVGLWALGATAGTPIGSLGASVALLVRAIGYGQQVSAAAHGLAERRAHRERLDRALARLGADPAGDGDAPLSHVGPVGLHDVGLRYPDAGAPALEGITTTFGPGQLVGIVGPSGAGKSTLVHLLLGLLEPTTGRIEAGGVDLAAVRRSDWYRLVAFVPQDPALLTGTVAENIRFLRPDIADEAVESAVTAAALGPDLARWPDGLDHHVGPLGANLSGGQRQRVALARALAGRPELLVLDEPTSALDARTEAAVRSTIEAVRGSATVLVVAHRLSTLRACDHLLVLADGRLAASGTPTDLAETDAYFREAVLLSGLRP
jgi:ATP-binding cassette, subfamily B, bacterial